MKQILIFIYLLVGIPFCIAASPTRIAVYVSSVLSEEYNTLLADNLVEAFAECDKYIAVNRSHALYELLNKAHAIQQTGHIDFAQVVNATKEFGETQLCAVSVILVNDTYVFRASILEVESNIVIKSTSYPSKKYELSYATIYTASQKLIEGLLPDNKPKILDIKPVEEKSKDKKKSSNCNIAWGIAGAGYPWKLVTSFNFRYGHIVGIGIYADLGMNFTHVSVENLEQIYGWTTVTRFHYEGGLKFYPYKGIHIGCGYGSIHKPKVDLVYNFHYQSKTPGKMDSNDAKKIRKMVEGNCHGLLLHAGYDWYSDFFFFLGFNGGVSMDFIHKKIEPMFNVKIGLSFDDI